MDKNYNKSVFLFKDGPAKELWDSIILILDENLNIEQENALSSSIEGEKRVHQCGRADAIKSIKNLLVEERRNAFVHYGEKFPENEK